MSEIRDIPVQEFGLTTVREYAGCFVKIQHLWKENKKKEFKEELQQNLVVSANPYKLGLVCVKLCPELYMCKSNAMAANILVELQSFLNQGYNKKKFELCLNKEIQTDAFQVAIKQKNTGLLRLLVKVFELVNIRDYLLPCMRDLQKEGRLKLVCILATLLGLQSQFSTAELIVPLFLQDRMSLTDEFLDGSPTHQKEILMFIDGLIGNKKSMNFEKYKDKDLQKVKSNKLLCNIVARLLKRYGLDSSICPHFQKHRAKGGLRYLFYKYYVEKGIQKHTFDSLVDDALEEHPYLTSDLMDLFIEYCDPQAALPYVTKLQLTSTDIPQQIKTAMLKFPYLLEQDKNSDQCSKHIQEEELWDEGTDDFYSLSIPFESVVLVDTIESLERCSKVLSSSPLVGIDTEWKPTFGIGSGEQAALMQLASSTQVFLVDLTSLQPVLKDFHWHLISQLFSNPQITKLGYGIKGDFKILSHLHIEMKNGIANAKNVIDLDQIKGILLEEYPNIFSKSDVSHKGLSDLIYRCFGLPLSKKEQFSNWAARPLTKSQIMYAAIDARCLLDVHAYLCQRAHDLNIPNWVNIKRKMAVKPKEKMNPQKPVNISQSDSPQKEIRGKDPIHAADFQVICDTMVQGLAKKLRSCGINAKALDNGESCDRCIEYFEKEKRVVLTRGGSYRRLCKYIPNEYVYNVQSEMAKEQLAEIIKVFNVKVTLNDVFARCSKCNSDSYIFVPSSILSSLHANTCNGILNKSAPDEWVNCQGGRINLTTGQTNSGVSIQVRHIHDSVLQKMNVFYVCSQCGKCYWEGSHHDRVINGRLKNIIKDDRITQNYENCERQGETDNDLVDSDFASSGYIGGMDVVEAASIPVLDTTSASSDSSINMLQNELTISFVDCDSDDELSDTVTLLDKTSICHSLSK